MKRRIIKQGNNSYTVTLPVKWIRNFGLNGGDEIELEEKGTEITLKTAKSIVLESKEIDVTGINDNFIRRILASMYKAGYDEIRVIYQKPETVAVIETLLKDVLMGYEIVAQKPDYLVIKSVSANIEEEFDNVLRRSFLVTINLAENFYEALRDNKQEQLKALLNLEITNNRLTSFCERILNKRGYKDPKKTTFIYTTEWLLEKIADTYKDMINVSLNTNKKVTSAERALLKQCLDLLRAYYELFYSFDRLKISETLIEYKKISLSAKGLLRDKKQDPVLCALLSKLSNQIFDLSGLVLGKEV